MSWPYGAGRIWVALWRPRGFLPLATLTLGIGLAAFTSAYTMVDSLLYASPFPHHASIVVYGEEDREPASRAASPMAYDAIGLPPGVVSRGAANMAESVNVHARGRAKLARGQRVDAGFLPTLGVQSILPDDTSIPFERGIMLSHAFWRDWLDADPGVVGRTMTVNGATMSVRGVLPADYRLLADIDLLLPLPSATLSRDDAANLMAIARLAPGVSGDDVSRWLHARSVTRAGASYGTVPLDVVLTSGSRSVVLLFFTCSLVVLAVAGLNLSSLMLTRELRRTHETSLIVEFGGFGWRSKLQSIADVAAISVVASVIGLSLARAIVVVIRPFVPRSWLLSALPIDLSWRICVTAALAAVVVTTAAAVLGSLHVSPDQLLRTQFATGGTQPAGHARRARRLIVLLQTTMAMLLLVLGVATASRLWRLMQVPLGFEKEGASFVEINPDTQQFPTLDNVRRAADSIRTAVTRLPGVESVGLTTQLPVGRGYFMPFRLPHAGTSHLQYVMVSTGAIDAMGLTLQAGRRIGAEDRAETPAVAMVNQAYLDRIDSRGLGGAVKPASHLVESPPLRIIGVVADTRSAGADKAAEPTVFVPFSQVDAKAYAFVRRLVPVFVVARGAANTTVDPQALRTSIGHVAPGLVAGPQQTFRQLARGATAEARRNAVLAALLSGMALSLACIGLYAVHTLEVVHRKRDMALRDALGATPLDLLGHALSRGIGMATPGVALGLVAAVLLEQGFPRSAVETGAIDAGVSAAAALLMICAALAAVALPSLRAAAVRPVHILRGEPTTSPPWPRRKEVHRS